MTCFFVVSFMHPFVDFAKTCHILPHCYWPRWEILGCRGWTTWLDDTSKIANKWQNPPRPQEGKRAKRKGSYHTKIIREFLIFLPTHKPQIPSKHEIRSLTCFDYVLNVACMTRSDIQIFCVSPLILHSTTMYLSKVPFAYYLYIWEWYNTQTGCPM